MPWSRTVRLLAREAARQKCQGVVALNVSFHGHGPSPSPLLKAASCRVTQSSPPRSDHPQPCILCHANRPVWDSRFKQHYFSSRKKHQERLIPRVFPYLLSPSTLRWATTVVLELHWYVVLSEIVFTGLTKTLNRGQQSQEVWLEVWKLT